MLDTKDIELLQNIIVTTMNQQFSEQDKKWETILDQRFTQQNESWETILDQRFAESENLVLEELDRVETRLTRRMDKMQDNLDDLNRLCRILLLEKGNYELLERRVATLESRVYPQ
ncbi:MAG: hypothetical protein SOX11_06180 [Lachnospiraceae bacterium]|nr:hypothetical protein [Lachnospiraceae bacterium]